MANDLREYSGWLGVAVHAAAKEMLDSLANSAGLEIDVADGYVEFQYAGRDTNRFVLKFLSQVAGFSVTRRARFDVRSKPKMEILTSSSTGSKEAGYFGS